MEHKLVVTPSPHMKDNLTTTKIMADVIIALSPAAIASVIIFGPSALMVILTCVVSSVLFEYLFNKVTKRVNNIGDLSAVVTGILLAFNLPATIPLYIAVIGSFIAIVIVKMLFGGIGQNFSNPALTARIVLLASFATPMTNWVKPFFYLNGNDLTTSATPLESIKTGGLTPNLIDMFLGVRGGSLGETCILALLIGGAYLIFRGRITPTIPLTYLATVFIMSFIFNVNPLFQLMAGGVVLGAFFMATDYATSPMTRKGQFIFALGAGVLTMLIRHFGAYPEGASFAIVLMNMLVPFIDKYTRHKVFGSVKA